MQIDQEQRPRRAIVAVPVCDEQERIAACLNAIAAQDAARPAVEIGVVLFVNNTTDGTMAVIEGLAPTYPLALRVLHEPRPRPHDAGWARRCAMEAAAEWLEAARDDGRAERGVILTTDADSRVAPDWIRLNLAALDGGADAVAGRVRLDPEEARALPRAFRARGRLERAYEGRLAELRARLAPRPHDPWPRHDAASGASIAVRLDAYRRVGGMPEIPVGEDLAFLQALAARGFRVRHDPAIVVTTSARLVGRAVGGSADAMRVRCAAPNAPCDERLEPAGKALRRAMGRPTPPAAVGVRPSSLPIHILLIETVLIALRGRDAIRRIAPRPAGSGRIEIPAWDRSRTGAAPPARS